MPGVHRARGKKQHKIKTTGKTAKLVMKFSGWQKNKKKKREEKKFEEVYLKCKP